MKTVTGFGAVAAATNRLGLNQALLSQVDAVGQLDDKTRTIDDTDEIGSPNGRTYGLLVVYSEGTVAGDGVFPLGNELIVGRQPSCSAYIDDDSLSRHHAAIRSCDDEAFVVEDLGSRNGTFVGRRKIGALYPLPTGHLIRCGHTLLSVVRDIESFRGWRRPASDRLIGGPAIKRVLAEIETFAEGRLEVLLSGESGTGKELAARQLHERSGRAGPFVALNCAAIPDELFEAELFGVRRGAFTGASADRPGAFESAHGGTLFLDEIAEMPLMQQAKLLRAVEQKEVRAVGASRPKKLDVRVVTASHRDLKAAVDAGTFRHDLLYRLLGAHIALPSLRERREDIAPFVQHFAPGIQPSARFVEALWHHDWPGNVRELERTVREAATRAKAADEDKLRLRHLRSELQQPRNEAPDDPLAPVVRALERSHGNVSKVAAELGIRRQRIYELLEPHAIDPAAFRRKRRRA